MGGLHSANPHGVGDTVLSMGTGKREQTSHPGTPSRLVTHNKTATLCSLPLNKRQLPTAEQLNQVRKKEKSWEQEEDLPYAYPGL